VPPSRIGLRRSHLLLDSTVLSLRQCRCHLVAMACPRHRCRGRRRRRRNPTPRGGGATAAVGGGGATPPLPPTSAARLCHLRPLGSGLARADGSQVAPPRSVLNINTLAIQTLCAAAAIQALFGCGPGRPISKIMSYETYIPHSAVICQQYTWYI
jgi:hypothetical protein